MSVLTIVTPEENEAALRVRTEPVKNFDSPELQRLIDDMIDTMRDKEGVGLAAPQVGLRHRLAVVETLPEYNDDGDAIPNTRDLFVVVNPEIIWRSRKEVSGIEGCLSIPGYLGEVWRSHSVTIRAHDRHGKRKRFRLKGWDARIFQHEIDHLDGVLYTDKLTAPENFWTEEAYEKMRDAEEAEEAQKAK
ncbi:MAG: peptide deformylase [Candidatus Promineifilaceae bacterium]